MFLPDCRAYELVTPPYKDGSPPEEPASGLLSLSSDGNHVLEFDSGGFAGTESDELGGTQKGAVYESTRRGSGWTTEAIGPPAELASRSMFVAGSSDLDRSLWELSAQVRPGEEIAGAQGLYNLAIREKTPGGAVTFAEVGPEDPLGAPAHSFVFEGAASDLSTIVFSNVGKKTHWPGDKTHAVSSSLYAYSGTGNREPLLVGVRNEGPLVGSAERNEHAELISECGTELGSGAAEGNTRNAVSGDGSTIVFTAEHGTCETPAVDELYSRVDASKTVAISEPTMTERREAECSGVCREDESATEDRSPAIFQGASKDDRRVFFTTTQPLLDLDGDTGTDIYEADLEGGALTRLAMVSRGRGSGGPGVEDPTPGANADVYAVVRVSDDGGHVYFIAQGVLTKAANGVGEAAQAGAYNLYDYDSSTGTTNLVAVLMSVEEEQAARAAAAAKAEVPVLEHQAICERQRENGVAPEEVEECEAEVEAMREALPALIAIKLKEAVDLELGLGRPHERLFVTTADGRYVVFESTRHLTGPEDTSTVRQLFEYDAATGILRRVSVGQNGYNDNGNTTNAEYAPRIVVPDDSVGGEPTAPSASLSVSEAGSVFFTSRDRLTSTAVEGHENVYEYEPAGTGTCDATALNGCVGLISPGDEVSPAEVRNKPRLLGADPSGRDVFFVSAENLLPRDADSQLDWYDARVGGGFAEASPTPECGEGSCQGPALAAPALPSPAGSALQGGEAPLLVSDVPAPPPKRLTSAQKLAKTLRACRAGARKKRRACELRARRKFARKPPAKKSGGRGR
jgi:hypothetical protein